MSTSGSGRYHRGDLRASLFEAALELLAEDGADALSLREVARRAGVSAMAPYRHYAGKQALLAALATHGFRGLHDALRRADREAAPGQALVDQAVAYVHFALAHPALFRLISSPKGPGAHADLVAAADATFGVLSQRVAAEAADGRGREARAVGCWALAHGLAVLFLDGQISERMAGPTDEVIRRVAQAMLTGAV